MSGTSSYDLISAIYAATLSPSNFDTVMQDVDQLLFFGEAGGGAPFARAPVEIDPATAHHIEIARSIQQRIGQARTAEQRSTSMLESVPNPTYLVARPDLVVAANALAISLHGRRPSQLGEVIADPDFCARVRDFIVKDTAGKLHAIVGHARQSGEASETTVLVRRVEPGVLDTAQGPVFLVSMIDFGFDPATVELFRTTYGLTQAESGVAVLLASGARLPDIAERRGVSIDTIRTQIKLVKQKTGARDIPALVRLLCGFSVGVLGPGAESGAPRSVHPPAGPMKLRRSVALPDGRKLSYLEQGAPGGEPVLLFHNLPYGDELPAAAIERCHREGLRIIAPQRPGFGESTPLPGLDCAGLLDQVAADTGELLRQLGIRRALVVSHSTGAAFALRFATRHPDSVTGLVALARAPIWREEWLAATPRRQRLMLRLARQMPQLVPVLVWSMAACMDSPFAREFVAFNCRDGAADSRAVENSETVELIAGGSVRALRPSVDAFARETQVVMMDLAEEARQCRHRFHILHGAADAIVDVGQSRTFVDEVPGTTLDVLEDAGQLLFFSHWPKVVDALVARVGGRRRSATAA
jgi:pimeloyl-ACP methyl ester carboxylesterase/DNA-binding CsgD family transcriptional regulator